MGPDDGTTETVYDSGTSTWITVDRGQGFALGTTVYLDWESGDISVGNDTDYIVAWCKTVAAAGYLPGVYCHPSEVSVIAAQLAPYGITPAFWVAYWTEPTVSSSTTQFPTYDPTQAQASATSWQYGSGYTIQTVNGPLGNVDLDTTSIYGAIDTTPPTVIAFSVSPTSLTVGSSVTISFTVSDTGGSGLNRVELWRATDAGGTPGTWAEVGSPLSVSGNGPVSSSFSDIPTVGEFWYGIHVVDGNGNVGKESDSGLGPKCVTVTAFPGYTPAQIRNYYGLNQVTFNGTAADGAGQTIAIVELGDDPKLQSDLGIFDSQEGLAAPPNLTIVGQDGGSKLPDPTPDTAEESLDVEWAYAIAPSASILVVEATDSGDMTTAPLTYLSLRSKPLPPGQEYRLFRPATVGPRLSIMHQTLHLQPRRGIKG